MNGVQNTSPWASLLHMGPKASGGETLRGLLASEPGAPFSGLLSAAGPSPLLLVSWIEIQRQGSSIARHAYGGATLEWVAPCNGHLALLGELQFSGASRNIGKLLQCFLLIVYH